MHRPGRRHGADPAACTAVSGAVRAGRGFTLIELMVTLAIIGLLAAIAIPTYAEFTFRARVARAISELDMLQIEIHGYYLGTETYPDNLADLGRGGFLDPWGNAYRYLKIEGAGGGLGGLRKDRSLVPVNSDFDLYSIGKDGQTSPAFTAANSQDDVVRANNGTFLGLVKNY
jgi:general secretion pathway protein G